MPTDLPKFLLSAVLWGAFSASALGLVIRHDTPTLDYENYGKNSDFNASTGISRANDNEFGIAGATAIDSRWGVHARHTLRHVETYLASGNNANLRGTRWNGWNFQGLANVRVQEVIHFDDDFTRFASAIDIAVVTTVGKSSALRIAPLNMGWDEVGRVGSGVSAANNRQDGNGNSKKDEAQATSNSGRWYEVRWGGKNDINQVNTQSLGSPPNALLRCDFDHPTNPSRSIMGGTTAIDLEYGSMNGDSGSPIYIEKNGLAGQIAGVVSGGSGNVYGSSIVYVRIRPYVNWITDTVLANPDNRTLSSGSIPDQIVNLGETLSLTQSASGSDQGPLSPVFSLVSPPSGMTIESASGEITWTPTASQANQVFPVTVRVTENGIVRNSVEESFTVTVAGDNLTEFWQWSAAPPGWSKVTISGGSPYGENSAAFPHLQGDTNTQLYQQLSGTLPAWATVTVTMKAADFHQTWSNGGPLEYGFFASEPTVANAGDPFLHSAVANVPDYNGAALADGLGNTGGNVDFFFSFETTAAVVDPWFAVRKNEDGDRFGVDDITVSYLIVDTDGDGLPDLQEAALGTDATLADTDGDGLTDGEEVILMTDPLSRDSDDDGYADGYEITPLETDPLDPTSPTGPDTLAVGLNFVALGGGGAGIGLPPHAFAGAPEVAQKNWNQTAAFSSTSGGMPQIASPQAGVLVDSTGAPTPIQVSFTMSNTWSANNEKLTPYGGLYSGYLDTSAALPQAQITFTDIPYDDYEVYVYFGSGANGRRGSVSDGTTTYSFTSSSVTTIAGEYMVTSDTGSGEPVSNYAVFSGKSGSTCSITYHRIAINGGINAVQIVPIIVLSPYEQWMADYLLDPATNGGLEVDADGDGLSNLLEFVLYSDPSDSTGQPIMELDQDATTLSLVYKQAKGATDYAVTPEWSTSLESEDWHSSGISVLQVAVDSGSLTYQASLPKLNREKLFLRLKVEAL